MEDTKQSTQSVETPATDKNEVKGGNKATFTQEDVDKIVAKRLSEANAKSQDATQNAVKMAIAEYERQAKLTQEEREKEAKTKREAELKEREESISLRERRLEALEMLQEKHIPIDLVDFVVDIDTNKTKENIEKLTKTYNKSVETGITDKLKGNPPTDFSHTKDTKKETNKFSGRVSF